MSAHRRVMLTRKQSVVTATAVCLMVALLVGVNTALVSCESTGSGWARSDARAAREDGATTSARPANVAPPINAWLSTAPLGAGGEPIMRVRIRTAVQSAKITLSDGAGRPGGAGGMLALASDVTGATSSLMPVGRGGTGGSAGAGGIEATISRGMFVVHASGPGAGQAGARAGVGAAGFPTSAPLLIRAEGSAARLVIDGQEYPGQVRLIARSDVSPTAFDVIELVPLEDYLPGVVAKEMLAGWPGGAYEVQAVAARSYALHERQRSLAAREVFDVDSSERDQVYAGSGGLSRDRRIVEAVRATRGQVLTWQGRVLRAYFSSTCGGRTGAARQTWPTGPGWEFNLDGPIQEHGRGHACGSSPLYTWTVQRDRDELAVRLRAFGERNQLLIRRLKELHAIASVEHNAAGRPVKYRIIEPGGAWYELSGEQLRLACNTPAPGLPAIERSTRVNSSDFEVNVQRGGRSGATVVFTGRGFGHGVGMCQYCAKGFAERGEGWRAMLARFYPGAEVRAVY